MANFKNTFKNNWQLIAFGFLLQFFSIGGQTIFISLFGGYIREDLSLSHGEFGGYYSIATFLSALFLVYTGKFVDQIDLKKITTTITIFLALSCIMMAFIYNMWMLIICFFLLRHLGQGLFSLIGTTAIVRYINHNRGTVNSISRMGYSAAEGIMPIIVVSLLVLVQWQNIWLIMAACLLLITLPLSNFLLKNHRIRHQDYLDQLSQQTDHEETLEESDNTHSNISKQYSRTQVLRDPIFYLITPCLLSTPMLFTGYIFHQIQLLSEKGWELSWWSSILLTYSITGLGFILGSGLLIDRYTARRILILIPFSLGIGSAMLSYAEGLQMAAFAIVILSFAGSLSSSISAPLFVELYGTKHLGSIKSLSTSLMVFSTSISPFIIGFFLDKGFSFNAILLSGSIYCLISLLLLLPTKFNSKVT